MKKFNLESLVGVSSKDVLLHGPSKNYVSNYHWHSPDFGIVASYTPNANDVKDHFGMFRGVDMIESFCQATAASLSTFISCRKLDMTFAEAFDHILPLFISIGQVNFYNFIQEGETFISIGHINFYKFRQMVCDGRIYKVPSGYDLDAYFKNYTDEKLKKYEVPDEFTYVAELFDITGRGFKKDKLKI